MTHPGNIPNGYSYQGKKSAKCIEVLVADKNSGKDSNADPPKNRREFKFSCVFKQIRTYELC